MLVKLIYRKYLKKSLSQVEYRFIIIFFGGGGACYGLVTVVRNHCSQLRGRAVAIWRYSETGPSPAWLGSTRCSNTGDGK